MSGYITVASKALDDGIFYQDLNELTDNIIAVKEFPKSVSLGGDPKAAYTYSAYALIEDPIYIEIDGTNVGGMTYEVHFMGQVTAADTGWMKLIRLDTSALVVEVSFTSTALAFVKSAAFTLASGTVQYAVHCKATTGGVASPFRIYGLRLVQR